MTLRSLYIPFVYFPNNLQKPQWHLLFCILFKISIYDKANILIFLNEMYSFVCGLLLFILYFYEILFLNNIQQNILFGSHYINIFTQKVLVSALIELSHLCASMFLLSVHLTPFICYLHFFFMHISVCLVNY